MTIARFLPRHAIAAVLLYVSWHSLNQWYLYEHYSNFLIFFGLFVIALVIASAPYLSTRVRSVRESRIVITFFIALFLFPWGEVLRLNFISSRLDWSRQIFNNAIFLYAVLILFQLIPSLPGILNRVVVGVTTRISKLQRKSLLWMFGLISFFAFVAITELLAQQTPRVQDTAAHLFQAKTFSHWKLYAPAPPVSEFFNAQGDMLVIHNGKWFSMYGPGLSALLSIFMHIGAEWDVCPLLASFTVVLWLNYAWRWYGRKTAVIFTFLFLFSPFVFLMSSTIMVHSVELFIATAIFYLCRLEAEGASIKRTFLISILIVCAMLVRAFSMIPFIAPILAYTAFVQFRRMQFGAPLILALGFAVGGGLLALYQQQTTGNPYLSGYLLEYPGYKYGFGSSYLGEIHTPGRALEQISNDVLGLNFWLTGWYSGSIFFLIAFFLNSPKFETWDKLLLLSCLSLILFYFFSAAQDLVYGPRFLYPLAPILLLCIARSFRLDTSSTSTGILLTALFLVSFVTFFGERLSSFLAQARPPLQAIDLKEAMQTSPKTLLFLDPHIPQTFENWNDPFLTNDTIIVRDLSDVRGKVKQQFRDYTPKYFRLKISMNKGQIDAHLQAFDSPDENPPGYISYFNLVMALEGDDAPEQYDFFDTCYQQLLTAADARQQLAFVNSNPEASSSDPAYKQQFRNGIWHAARLLLLPKLAYESYGSVWSEKFDFNEFRSEYDNTIVNLQNSGDIGKKIVVQLLKVRRRIDQDDNGTLSDQEISKFLSEKLRLAA